MTARTRRLAFTLAAASVAWATTTSAVCAQQPSPPTSSADTSTDPHAVQPERPTVATHAGTVAPGWVEIEAGLERDRFDPTAIGYTAPMLVKVGMADRVQLGLFGAWNRPARNVNGFGDAGLSVKWRLLEAAPVVGDFAMLGAAKFPTGSVQSNTGTGTTDGTLIAISSHDFGPFSLDINAGYTRRTGDGTAAPTSSSMWAVSGGGPFAGRLGWALECYGYPGTSGPAGRAPVVAALGGPTLLVRRWLQIDAGVIAPIAGPQPRALYTGAVYNVGRLWPQRP